MKKRILLLLVTLVLLTLTACGKKGESGSSDEKNAEIVRLYEQLKAKDEQLAKKDEQLRVKDVQIAEKDKQLDQQQQLTLQAMNDRDTLKLELEQANEKVQEQESKGFWARVFRR